MQLIAALVLAGGLMGLISDTLALWTGPMSATWDADQYIVAQQMKLNGAHPEEIRAKTGIWWGPDGKPRAEIDDSIAVARESSGILGQALDHEHLYKAYPEMRSMQANVEKAGFFSPQYGGFYAAAFGGNPESITLEARPSEMKGQLLHEVQHAIQTREGFALGGVPLGATVQQVRTDPIVGQQYLRIKGEAEARAVARRSAMTVEQRRASTPESSYDVPINELK